MPAVEATAIIHPWHAARLGRQHWPNGLPFESLNDVVAQITRVRVRETVPDSMFDRTDAVALVDLTPEDLIER